MPAERPAVFFDRDGTLIEEVDYCDHPSRVRAVPGATEALLKLSAAGFALVIVTNQSGIGRGYFTHDDYRGVHEEVIWQLKPARILGTYYDDSTPDKPSARRKPSPAMLEEAARQHGLDLSRSWMVGDKTSDIECGKNAGLRTVLVETGHGRGHLDCGADAVVPDIGFAADFILREVACPK
ncbi:MAG: HAD family hydrolase [Chthoniobacterales bacterium]|jgi:D-glycero-D-manno-heptose 1,7-bisphosphate phosphatase|nr:HAD family hydrolase [Chthoniobacterales bacterium]